MNVVAPVVSNAGPFIVLAKLNLLHLLESLYGRIHFATSVYEEVVISGMRQGHEDARTASRFLDQVKWLPEDVDVTEIPDDLRVVCLDRGERDTLVLAVKLDSELVLIDEAIGRQEARNRGFSVRGSLGILIQAYRKGFLSAEQLRLNLNEIAHRQDIWVNPALVQRLLREIQTDRTDC